MATCTAVLMCACQEQQGTQDNPLLTEFQTPFGVPPFEQIRPEHYKPAFLKAMEEANANVEAIINNPETPNFQNTIAALDQSDKLLETVGSIFFAQCSACSSPELEAISQEISPLLSKHSDDINMNAKLFERVHAVYENRDNEGLDKEQMKLLNIIHRDFLREGVNLKKEDQDKLRELNSRISQLQLTFGQNMLKETNAFKLIIDNAEDLKGLPQDLIETSADSTGTKWIFTLKNPSVMPFLQYAENRNLREQIFKAYINRGNNGNENDNKQVCADLVKARLEKARLMGYEDYAAYALETRMAKNESAVYELLNRVWEPALKKAKEELADIQTEIKKEGNDFEAEGWDWSYYANKAKNAKFDFDENLLRPYLKLENVREGMFLFAHKLYGINFTAIDSIPLPHPEAQAFECKDEDGSHLGVLYMDFFPRESKRGGAWCGEYRGQSYKDGQKVAPVVTIVCNFTKPAPNSPALLTPEEAQTMYHEFGHALNCLFRDVHYKNTSWVARDFVELPSQVNEHWTFEPQMLREYARHYETGELVPDSLVKKFKESEKYGQGFATTEYVAASLLDMDFHTLKEIPDQLDVTKMEEETLAKRGLIRQIPPRYRTTYFNHTMGGGYTAGYYSYLWAEQLDADAFEAYCETGDIFNQELASKFRNYILKPGCIDDEMDMYIHFRGKKPGIEPLLKNRGLN